MLLGIFFIVSAIAKLCDMDRFEIYIFSYNILPLNVSFLTARVVTVCELLVGIGLVANVFKRLVDTCAMLMLVGFTLFLGYAILIGREDSCHCMGALLDIDPTHSILKNALLVVLLLFAMGAQPWRWRPRWYVWLPVLLAPTVTVFVVSAPDNWLFGPSEEVYYKNLYNFSAPGLILTGVVILAFFFYLVKRFLLKGCQGPKNVEQSYRYTTYFLIGFGILIGLIFHIFTIYNAAVSK